jgi:hypothetical protein
VYAVKGILVASDRMLHRLHDAAREIAAVCVVANLGAVSQNVKRILPAQCLLDQVRHDVAHRELDIAAHYLDVAESPTVAHPNAVEWPDNRVGELMLVPRGVGEVLDGELLEAVRRERRWALPLVTLLRWPPRGRLEDHG